MKIENASRRQFLSGAASTVVMGTILTTTSLARPTGDTEEPSSPLANPSRDSQVLDALIVGGGPAGLSAALYLGRARMQVLVLDRGRPRHSVSPAMHNYLTRDGLPPARLRAEAWTQMGAYPSVRKQSSSVAQLRPEGEFWLAHLDNGSVVTTRAVVLATGMVDQHPSIPGYSERWGHSIHHCPFCHGWEMRDKPLAALSWGSSASHIVPLLKNWSDDVVLITHGQKIPDEVRLELSRSGTLIYGEPIVALEGVGKTLQRIRLEGGTILERQGLFVKPTQTQVELVSNLGIELDGHGFVKVDPWGSTSLPGIWAAGDTTSGFHQVIEAASQGARVGTMIVASLSKPAIHARKPAVHSRDTWQKPLEVVKLAQIAEGMVVADVGAGEGYFEPYLSRAVGPSGRVIAVDIQPVVVEICVSASQAPKISRPEREHRWTQD